MVDIISQATTDDLFVALNNKDFVKKLHDAAERRIRHHNDWFEYHRRLGNTKGMSREFKRTKEFMDLEIATLKLM